MRHSVLHCMIVSLFVGFSITVYVNKNKQFFITIHVLVRNVYVVCTYVIMCLICTSGGSIEDLVEKHPVWLNLEDQMHSG